MKVLVGYEFSGIVRDAFIASGHDAISVDLLPSERNGPHFQGDMFQFLSLKRERSFDLGIFFYPCTNLCVSGARWWPTKRYEQSVDIHIVKTIFDLRIKRIALENPIGILSTTFRKPDQIIQPWMFGHMETKSTCIWLKNLPLLIETNNVKKQMELLPLNKRSRVHYASPGPERWKERSRTLPGIAQAMTQWATDERER